jgi:hypothetical protein
LGFSHTRPVFVADDLAELHGPTTGIVTLPIHIDWTPSSTYDLAEPQRIQTMYETVLREAGSENEIATWICRDLLMTHWLDLNLPTFTRTTWESVHPQLCHRRGDVVPPTDEHR